MSRDIKYIGMDVHKEAVVIAVLNSSGKLVMESIVETKASSILQFIHGLRGELHVTWEEGTWAAWLYDLLQPQVARVLVCDPRRNALLNRRRLGHITKQGSSMLRLLLVEAAQVTARSIPEWRSTYFQLAMRRGRKVAKVAMARRLAIALYWMWRKGWNYEQSRKFGSHAGQLGTGDGVQ